MDAGHVHGSGFALPGFRRLGAFDIGSGGRRVAQAGGKQPTITALMAIEAQRVVTAARLIDAVWGDHAAPAPRSTRQVNSCHVRPHRAFDPGGTWRCIVHRAAG